MDRNPITPEGYTALVARLKHLKSVVRPGIVRDIEEARAHGDISENSEYEDAKERQSLTEGRIIETERLVASAEIIDVTKLNVSDRVVFGTTVVLADSGTGEEKTWRIVGETETDVPGGLISCKSPLARAMIGKSEGDEVVVATPKGNRVLEILEIHYR
jgi:transcription elongation factor GreA